MVSATPVGGKMHEYAIQILKNEHRRLVDEEPFSKYITELERAIGLLKKGRT